MACATRITNPDGPRCASLHRRSRTCHKRGLSPLFNSFTIPKFEGLNIGEDVHQPPKATVQQPFNNSFLTYIKYGEEQRQSDSHTTLLYNGNTVQVAECTPELYTNKKGNPHIVTPKQVFPGPNGSWEFLDFSQKSTNHAYFSFYLSITTELSDHYIENSILQYQYMEIGGKFKNER